jgi:multiple sugar transport system substrate-binding protein
VSSEQLSRRRFLARSGKAALAVGAGGSWLAACGGSGSENRASGGRPTLTWWDYFVEPNRQQGVKDLIADLERHAGVTIKRRVFPFNELNPAILRGAASGDLPDVAIIDNTTTQAFFAQGITTDLTPYVAKWNEGDRYIKGAWDNAQYQGKTVSIPNNANCLCLYYDAQALDTAGIDVPKDWDQLAAAAKGMTTGTRKGLSMSAIKGEEGVFQFLPFLWQSGGDLQTFATAGVKPLAFLAGLVENGSMSKQVVGWTQQDANTAFAAGRAAMQINGPWQLPTLATEAKGIDYRAALLPVDKMSASCLGGEHWVIPKGKDPDKVWAIIERSQQPKVLVPFLDALGLLPARTDVADQGKWSTDEILAVFVEQLKSARPRAYGPGYPQASDAMSQAEQAALSGAKDPSSAARSAAPTITEALAQS